MKGKNNLAHMIKRQSKEKALIKDLQKTDALNPFGEESKKAIHNLGKVGYSELCEFSSKTQCSSCSKYWADGVVYWICENCLIPPGNTKRLTKEKFDSLSIPYFVIKKGSYLGARHGKTDDQRQYHQVKVSSRKDHNNKSKPILERFQKTGNSSRFLKDSKKRDTYCESQMAIGWTENTCRHLDQIANEDRSYTATCSETGCWL